jgi:hypothetical protein
MRANGMDVLGRLLISCELVNDVRLATKKRSKKSWIFEVSSWCSNSGFSNNVSSYVDKPAVSLVDTPCREEPFAYINGFDQVRIRLCIECKGGTVPVGF